MSLTLTDASFLHRTGQLWRLRLLVVCGMLVVAWHGFNLVWAPAQSMKGWDMVVSMTIAPATLVWVWLSVRCPSCKGRILSYAFNRFDVSRLYPDLTNMTSCPYCQYRPPPRLPT